MISIDHIVGALLGTAVGDALGMPVEGLSHQNVRMYYKGIKEYRADEKRGDLQTGQWTGDTQRTFAMAGVLALGGTEYATRLAEAYTNLLPEARRWDPVTIQRVKDNTLDLPHEPTNGAAMIAAPLGAWWAATGATRDAAFNLMMPLFSVTHRHPAALAAGFGQACAIKVVLTTPEAILDRDGCWKQLVDTVIWAEDRLGDDHRVSKRLQRLTNHLRDFPLDLQDLCDGTGTYADESWPFAVAMFVRNPRLLEASLLSAINVGGDANTVGAMVGALLGAWHGWAVFPAEWKEGLEATNDLEARASQFAEAMLNR